MKDHSRYVLAIVVIFIPLAVIFSHFIKLNQTFSYTFREFKPADPQLEKIVSDDLADQKGTYGVYIESLGDGGRINYHANEAVAFPAASLYKLVLLAAVYQEIGQGNFKLDTQMEDTKTHLTELYGGVDYGYEDADEDIVYTVDEAIDRVARLSDNFAAIMLTNELSNKSELGTEAQSLGMKHTNFAANPITTTPEDVAAFFSKLYSGQVVSKPVSDQLIGDLEKDQINDRIPALLPTDASGSAELKIAHKTGELPHVRHDAGVVFLSGNPYVIVLMGKDLPYEDDGISLEAKISKDVYDYFNEKS